MRVHVTGTTEVGWYCSDIVAAVSVSGATRTAIGGFGNICVIQWPCLSNESVHE